MKYKFFHGSLSAKLAWQDLKSEPILSLCLILGIVAVLAPLIVIAGLRSGVLTSIRQTLLEDPHAREIVNISNRSFTDHTLKELANRKDVEFLVPRTRTLAASLFMEKQNDPGSGRHIMLTPTAKGDPLLKNISSFIRDNQEVVLSSSAADHLHLKKGDEATAYLNRILNGEKQQVQFVLKIVAIAPSWVTDQDTAFLTLPLAIGIENYQDGIKNWPAQLKDLPMPTQGAYSGFRLYTHNINQLPALDTYLRQSGIDVVSKAGDVEGLLSLDYRLSLLFICVASLGGVGLCISLGAGLWANTERKRKSLALLRFNGFSAMDLILFPMVQAVVLALAGAIIALGAAYGAGQLINVLFSSVLPQGHSLFLLNNWIILGSLGLTLLGGIIVSLLSGNRAAKIQPWEGVTAL
ncbi:hypothetical protein [Commensalibacter papalotli (ex Botero et al. 2024)]|uniref:Permease component LolC (LolE) (PDB:6F49) n=1 Tax=Commensalibacter papalotli (ex Botero et al. 2024) TaxID=2972766 RepID=A0ABM9HIR9_9PROT|nr:hypothetical protein [Commensalibacter papalotli (ex Botero et al. 2024)]CAI3925334.1 ABC-type transport system involved in lipoprotein release [Commensalibacter papalotli (ex Botero et al. 2024)]CAI3926762.1 ABC-type transport system involved in lipoprotein release [Commensalibacter papalotli (ex Botero et al. 2024)]